MRLETILNAVETISGAAFIGIDTDSIVSLKGGKKNPLQGRVHKVTLGSTVMCFQNKYTNGYENMVRRRLEQEGKDPGSFKLSPRVWGTRLPELPIVVHEKDGVVKHYLEVIFMQQGKSHYYLDTPGNIIPRSSIVGLDTPKVSEESQGGLNNKVIIRTYDIESITALRINDTVHR